MPAVRTRATLPDDEIRARLRTGTLLRLRRGAYVATADLSTDPYRRRSDLLLARASAVVEQSPAPLVVSHTTAAVLWGLPAVSERVHVTHPVRPRTQRDSDVVRHTSALQEDEVCTVAGIALTSLARTALDCLRSTPGPIGLIIADAALRAGLTDTDATEALRRATAGRGVRRARAVLGHADDGAESAGESYARAVVLALGLPAPETQVQVNTVDGPFWSDLGWRDWRLLAEYDGRAKYGGSSAAPDALLREKRREDAVRDEGWRVLRISSQDTADPSRLMSRLSRVVPPGALTTLTPRPHLTPRPARAQRGARGQREEREGEREGEGELGASARTRCQ